MNNSPTRKSLCKHIFKLRRDGYDSFIDYLKGICILLVILTHCIPGILRHQILFSLWGGAAVPIFLIIQVFHTYKKGFDNVKKTNYVKLWQRIIKPFLWVELILIILVIGLKIATGEFDNPSKFFHNIIKFGGRGSGSYYPWIYIEFAIILPIIAPIFKKINGIYLAVAFILISELIEITCSLINMPEFIYRLLFIRYIFLIYLGYILVIKGYVLNWKTFLLSIISAASILVFVYTKADFSPFIFYIPKWKSCHWICYFYIAFFLLFIFQFLYQRTIRHKRINDYIKKMGIYSYEIFLFQMIYFDFHHYVTKLFSTIFGKGLHVSLLAIIFAVIICVVPVIYYKDYKLIKKTSKISREKT